MCVYVIKLYFDFLFCASGVSIIIIICISHVYYFSTIKKPVQGLKKRVLLSFLACFLWQEYKCGPQILAMLPF